MKRIATLALGMVFSFAAAANDDIELMKQYFNAGNSVAAYELGWELRHAYEGNPDFDYYFGAAAVDAGDASQGVFALERALMARPNWRAARLELARGYFLLEEYARSRDEFERVQRADPPEDVQAKITQYLNAIRIREGRYKSTARARFFVGFGSDDNVNQSVDDGTVAITNGLFNGLSLLLPQTSQAQDSSFSEAGFDLNMNFPLTTRWSMFAQGGLSTTQYGDEPANEFSNTTMNLAAGVKQRFGKNQITYSLANQAYILKEEHLRNLGMFSVNYERELDPRQRLRVYGLLTQTDYAQSAASAQESDQHILGASYSRQFPVRWSPLWSAGLSYGSESAQEDDNQTSRSRYDRDFYGLSSSVFLSFNARHGLLASVSWQDSSYDEIDPLFGVKQDGDLTRLRLDYNYLISRGWKFTAYASQSDNSSDHPLRDYDRAVYGLRLSYEH
ncbi:MAG: hypothetical protein ACQES2_06830 [Pseudomonadota bacterium]